jgi:hypothetical protein
MHEVGRPVAAGEVLDTEGYIEAVYDRLGIETALGAYLDGQTGTEDEGDITVLLAEFSMSLAEAATTRRNIDIPTVRFGVDHLTRNMNELCSSRFGYEPPKTLTEAMLLKLGAITPVTKSYVRRLDDRYWAKQFPEEYAEEKQVQRELDESDQQYLGRYIRTAIHGFIFAPFTYMR